MKVTVDVRRQQTFLGRPNDCRLTGRAAAVTATQLCHHGTRQPDAKRTRGLAGCQRTSSADTEI